MIATSTTTPNVQRYAYFSFHNFIECEGKVIILGKLGAASSVELFGRSTTISAVKCYRVVGNFIGVKKNLNWKLKKNVCRRI